MKQSKSLLYKVVSVVLVLILAVSTMVIMPLSASAAAAPPFYVDCITKKRPCIVHARSLLLITGFPVQITCR